MTVAAKKTAKPPIKKVAGSPEQTYKKKQDPGDHLSEFPRRRKGPK